MLFDKEKGQGFFGKVKPPYIKLEENNSTELQGYQKNSRTA
jgi:hypothetical protein